MDPLTDNAQEFFKAHTLKNSPPTPAPVLEKKKKCNCNKITVVDVITAVFAAYGAYSLGITVKDLVTGYFQKASPLSE